MSDAIEPYRWTVPQAEIDDLHRRIDVTRWPERETVADWSQGAPLAALQDFVDHWRHRHDWRAAEGWINAQGLSSTVIDGLAIRFLHVRSKHADARPLILTHGWPGSILEFREALPRLVDPEAHGGTAADAFHCVIPCLPGYGLSEKPQTNGWTVAKIAEAWGVLMQRLGYTKWYAQGGDWGAVVTTEIGQQGIAGCAGIHLNMPVVLPLPEDLVDPAPDAAKTLAAMQHYQQWDSGYSTQQATRPQTIGYALVDSPVGLAAWVYEKMWAWTDNDGRPEDALSRDAMCDNLMLYWLTAAGASSARLYWESFRSVGMKDIAMPVACSIFPGETVAAPRAWVERHCQRLVHWGTLDKGGHFAAWEQPETFVRELRTGFAAMD
jgi:pimeloyl-ACP methyl ester carboxylesterase